MGHQSGSQSKEAEPKVADDKKEVVKDKGKKRKLFHDPDLQSVFKNDYGYEQPLSCMLVPYIRYDHTESPYVMLKRDSNGRGIFPKSCLSKEYRTFRGAAIALAEEYGIIWEEEDELGEDLKNLGRTSGSYVFLLAVTISKVKQQDTLILAPRKRVTQLVDKKLKTDWLIANEHLISLDPEPDSD